MVAVDASVWVAVFRAHDAHHEASMSFLDAAVTAELDLHVPNLALAEIAGVFSRQTGSVRLAARTVRAALDIPRLQRHVLDDDLADQAALLAARWRLRGADAVHVALAKRLNVPLVTLDGEILTRAARTVRVQTPADWLRKNPPGGR